MRFFEKGNGNATGMPENKDAGIKGGKMAKKVRLELESKTGKSVITSDTKVHSKADRGGDEESTQAYVLVRRGE